MFFLGLELVVEIDRTYWCLANWTLGNEGLISIFSIISAFLI